MSSQFSTVFLRIRAHAAHRRFNLQLQPERVSPFTSLTAISLGRLLLSCSDPLARNEYRRMELSSRGKPTRACSGAIHHLVTLVLDPLRCKVLGVREQETILPDLGKLAPPRSQFQERQAAKLQKLVEAFRTVREEILIRLQYVLVAMDRGSFEV